MLFSVSAIADVVDVIRTRVFVRCECIGLLYNTAILLGANSWPLCSHSNRALGVLLLFLAVVGSIPIIGNHVLTILLLFRGGRSSALCYFRRASMCDRVSVYV